MTLVLVRDDDANATTDPVRLERVYAPLLDVGVPVNFAVIPEVALDTFGPDGRREGFIEASHPASSECITLEQSTPLCAWLRAHEGQLDVLMHGLSHRRGPDGTEFGAVGPREASAKLLRGLSVISTALGRAPRGFVAPWDALSRGALTIATRAFDLVSTGWVDRRKLPPSAWPAHFAERLLRTEVLRVGQGWVVRHRGCKLQNTTPVDRIPDIVHSLIGGTRVGVIVLHHWQFWQRSEPHPVIQALAATLRGRRVSTVRDVVRTLDADNLVPRPAIAGA